MKYGDLITVIILSYYSENTILDTLESVRNQTYKNIELIVSDDKSGDNTINIINKWVRDNSGRFFSSLIKQQNKNLGTSQNLNSVIFFSKGKWIKIIAADDILMADCVEDNVKYVIKQKCDSIVCSYYRLFKNNINESCSMNFMEKKYLQNLTSKSSQEQYQLLLKRDTKTSPTMFLNRKMLEKINGIDISIRNIEDWPLKLKITRKGYKLFCLEKETVYYRINESVSNSNVFIFNKNHVSQVMTLKKKLCYPNIPKYHVIYYYEEWLFKVYYSACILFFNNKINKKSKFFNCVYQAFKITNWKNLFKKSNIVKGNSLKN